MRGILGVVLGLTTWLTSGGAVCAGVYNPGATRTLPWPQNFHEVRFVLSELRGIALPLPPGARASDDSLRSEYFAQAARLESKIPDEWTLNDRLSLSACYIRMQKFDQALGILKGADQRTFLVLLNTATAYHGLDDLSRAREYQQAALAAWPMAWAGISSRELARARRIESYYLSLLQQREREQRLGQRQWTTTDTLFPGCRFVGPSGKYEAGGLALKSQDALPPDAAEIVLQLVLWMPFDDRLYWQLGEMLNARGEVENALDVFKELIDARNLSNVTELMQHRRTLLEAVDGWKKWKDALREAPAFNQDLLAALQLATLPGVMPPSGVGLAGTAVGALAPSHVVEVAAKTQSPAQKPSSDAGSWMPNWRHVTVSFVAGALVATLASLQWREWQRRHQAATAAVEAPSSDRSVRA